MHYSFAIFSWFGLNAEISNHSYIDEAFSFHYCVYLAFPQFLAPEKPLLQGGMVAMLVISIVLADKNTGRPFFSMHVLYTE